MRKTAIALATLVALAVAGCASTTDSAAPSGSAAGFAADVARDMHVDFDPLRSPADAVAQSDLIVRGTLVRVEQGIEIKTGDAALTRRFQNRYATFVVAVDAVLAGDAKLVTDGHVYVQVGKAATVDTGALAKANPRPDTVLVLEDLGAWRPVPGATVSRPSGVPAGAALFTAFPDGLWLQGKADAGMVGVQAHADELGEAWGAPKTLDEFAAAVARK